MSNNGVKPINPWRESTKSEQRIAWAAWCHKRNNSFLAHIQNHSQAKNLIGKHRASHLREAPSIDTQSGIKHFPEDQLAKLLKEGFIKPGQEESPLLYESHNLRDILIVLLMNAGGLRVSEPFHLYVSDVVEDPGKEGVALVRIYHPSEGRAPEQIIDEKTGRLVATNRYNFLRAKYGLAPRNGIPIGERTHAGWKHLLLDNNTDKSATVQWFPLDAGKMFWSLWPIYLAQRALLPESHWHPYAFVGNKGQIYCVQAFQKNYAAACKRIGLPVSHHYGTNPHGHRHAYGQRLANCNVPQMIIKKAMHHKSLQSQYVYTEATESRVQTELLAAQCRIDAKKDGGYTEKELQAMLEKLNKNSSPVFEYETLGWNSQSTRIAEGQGK